MIENTSQLFERIGIVENFQREMRDAITRIELLENRTNLIVRDLEIYKDTIKSKAGLDLVRRVETKFEFYTELTEFKTFQKGCLDFAKKDKLYQCEQRIDDIQNNFVFYAKNERIDELSGMLKQQIQKEMECCVKESQFESSEIQIKSRISMLKEEFKNDMKVFQVFQNNFDDFKK